LRTKGERKPSTAEALVVALEDRKRLAYARYIGGVDTQLNALDADRDLLQAELNLRQIRLKTAECSPLYKALGGVVVIECIWRRFSTPHCGGRGHIKRLSSRKKHNGESKMSTRRIPSFADANCGHSNHGADIVATISRPTR